MNRKTECRDENSVRRKITLLHDGDTDTDDAADAAEEE